MCGIAGKYGIRILAFCFPFIFLCGTTGKDSGSAGIKQATKKAGIMPDN
jgi:hypothetical protein